MRDLAEVSMNLQPKSLARASPSVDGVLTYERGKKKKKKKRKKRKERKETTTNRGGVRVLEKNPS